MTFGQKEKQLRQKRKVDEKDQHRQQRLRAQQSSLCCYLLNLYALLSPLFAAVLFVRIFAIRNIHVIFSVVF